MFKVNNNAIRVVLVGVCIVNFEHILRLVLVCLL